MPYGLNSTGFVPKPKEQIVADIQAKLLAGISPNLNLQAPDPLAVLVDTGATELAALWQLVSDLYAGMDPDVATGDLLAGLSLITGTNRLAAAPTTVVGCTVNLGAGFSAAPGTMFAYPVGNPAALFTNKTAVTNSGGSPANETVDFLAVNTGAIQALAGTLTQIGQPLTGWNSITNPTDGVIGTAIEGDPDLRTRREAELSASGSTTAAALKADVLQQLVFPTVSSNTLACTVLYNDTDATDANNVPPHAIEVIAYQAAPTSNDDLALATLILNNKAAGIGTHGLSQKSVVDSQGNTELISYTRPVPVTIYIAITVKTDPLKFGDITAGKAAIRLALATYAGAEWQPGVGVYANPTSNAVFPSPLDPTLGVPGVLDVTVFHIDTVYPAVASANIPIDVRHVAVLSTIDVTVT